MRALLRYALFSLWRDVPRTVTYGDGHVFGDATAYASYGNGIGDGCGGLEDMERSE